ncbi:MAG: D-alanine--D-alanine ligase family protein [Woeseiaceae bacterium]
MTTSPPRSVLILHEAFGADARVDEVDALVQVREVSAALERLGWQVAVAPVDLNLERLLCQLRRYNPTCVFNLVESLGRRGDLIGVVPALLQGVSIPFTGASGDAIQLTSQKILAKRWLSLHGIGTPEWFTDDGAIDNDRQRWIVKSLWEHASFGLDDSSVVQGRIAARQRIRQRARELGGQWFAERYIDGREFNISLLEQDGEPQVLPIAEMTFVDYPSGKPKIVGYPAKWDETAGEYHATRRAYPELRHQERDALQSVALECWKLFELRGYARVDIRMDEQGRPSVLEINANPCVSRDAGFVAAADEAGIRYDRIIECIVEAALCRGRQRLQQAG